MSQPLANGIMKRISSEVPYLRNFPQYSRTRLLTFPCPILAGLYYIHFLNNKDFFASYANMNI